MGGAFWPKIASVGDSVGDKESPRNRSSAISAYLSEVSRFLRSNAHASISTCTPAHTVADLFILIVLKNIKDISGF